jgi:hypothetical protein
MAKAVATILPIITWSMMFCDVDEIDANDVTVPIYVLPSLYKNYIIEVSIIAINASFGGK